MGSILALDQGTTGSTALVIHQDGSVLGRGYREFKQYYPRPGWVEHDPEEIFRVTLDAAREAMAGAGEIPVGIGITNQRETIVLWDRRTLKPVAPAIVWQDRRTAERCRELKALGHESAIRERTGLVLDPYFSATKLEHLLRDPDLMRRASARRAGGGHDRLLADCAADRRAGSCHRSYQRVSHHALRSRGPGVEQVAAGSVRGSAGAAPGIVPSAGVVGESEAGHFGHSLPIAGIAGDQQAALFGQGCVRAGLAKNTYGTGAFLLSFTGQERPVSKSGLLLTAACGPQGEPAYALEGSVFIAGAAVQWLRDGLGLITRAHESEELARSVPDTGGVYFVPAFVGLGSPHWEAEARGSIVGLTRGSNRAHLVRAALEAMAFSSADLLEAMVADAQLTLAALRVDGGASANDWLMQCQADLLGVPVERPDNVETTALGAGGLAGIALGLWRSSEEFLAGRRFARFEPRIDQSEREQRWKGWRRAVQATLSWARSG